MKIIIAKSIICKCINVGCLNEPSKGGRLGKSNVIKEKNDHVWGISRWAFFLRPPFFRFFIALSYFPFEFLTVLCKGSFRIVLFRLRGSIVAAPQCCYCEQH